MVAAVAADSLQQFSTVLISTLLYVTEIVRIIDQRNMLSNLHSRDIRVIIYNVPVRFDISVIRIIVLNPQTKRKQFSRIYICYCAYLSTSLNNRFQLSRSGEFPISFDLSSTYGTLEKKNKNFFIVP